MKMKNEFNDLENIKRSVVCLDTGDDVDAVYSCSWIIVRTMAVLVQRYWRLYDRSTSARNWYLQVYSRFVPPHLTLLQHPTGKFHNSIHMPQQKHLNALDVSQWRYVSLFSLFSYARIIALCKRIFQMFPLCLINYSIFCSSRYTNIGNASYNIRRLQDL
jgi:hypothetical protein